MPPTPACRRSGLTLIELIVVLVILVALAAMVVPLVGTGISSAEIDITFTTMQRLRDAIMGGNGTNAGYFADLKGVPIPGRGDTYGLPYTVPDLLTTAHFNPPAYNPQTQRGWRGPYITQSIGGTSYQILDSFPNGGQPGTAMVIQWPDPSTSGIPVTDLPRYVRLVSYGPDGLPSPATAAGTTFWLPGTLNATKNWGDDVILYVRRDLPGMDWTNYWELKKALRSP